MPRAGTKLISARIPLGVNQDHWIEFAAISDIIMVSIDRPNPIKKWKMSSGLGKYAVTPRLSLLVVFLPLRAPAPRREVSWSRIS
jgi:hypothetical protein